MKTTRRKHGNSRVDSAINPASSCHASWLGRGRVAVVVGLLLLAFSFSTAPAQGEVNSEYRVKMAFLYNFAQFVEWPADAFSGSRAPLVICVAGDNPFQGDIEQSLRGRSVGGHPIEVSKLLPGQASQACQIIFVRAMQMKDAPRIFASVRSSSTLTVGEANGFAQRGGIINLTRDENRLRFEVNIGAAAQSRLKISSKLLALAKVVQE